MTRAFLIAAALLPLALAPPGARAQPPAEESCRLLHDRLPAAFARCATIGVPLAYDRPDGERLELFVARVPALTATPEPDPLLLINGGPGGSAVDLYLQTRNAFEPIRRKRDILLLDQRGTGRSLAGLDCELPDDFDLTTARADEIRNLVEGCIADFAHDPRQFTTSVAVRDLETVRETLGIAEWNIYGVSYGTRVAQHYLRRHGEHLRTLILDGVVPADLALGPAIAADAERALDAIFARCGATPGCRERFGDLHGKFAEVRDRLASRPLEVRLNDPLTGEPETIELTERHLQGAIRFMSYSDATAALLPLIIDAAFNGNYQPLAAQAELQIESVTESIGFAMHNSVVCTEDAPWFPTGSGAGADHYLGRIVIDGLAAICESWPAGEIDDAFKAPVSSDRPVLLLSGEFDPVTPPDYATRVLAGFDRARHLVVEGRGHGVAGVGCMPDLLEQFVDTADPAAIDADCLNDGRPMPFFTSFQGPDP